MFSGSFTSDDDAGMVKVDRKGKLDTTSVNGHINFLTVIEEWSEYTITYTMKKKTDASELLLNTIFDSKNNQAIKSEQYMAIVELHVFGHSIR